MRASLFFLQTALVWAHESCCSGGMDDHDHDHGDGHHDHHGDHGLWERVVDSYIETWPWVFTGLLLTVCLQLTVLPIPTITKFLKGGVDSRAPGLLMCAKAAIMGLCTPLCSCGSLPFAMTLIRAGVPSAAVVSFLTAAQSSGFDSAAVTYGLLGWRAMAGRLVGAFFLATVAGCVATTVANPLVKGGTSDACCGGEDHSHDKAKSPSFVRRVFSPLLVITDAFDDVVPYVAVGVFLSTLITVVLPSITSLMGAVNGESASTMIIIDIAIRIGVFLASIPLQLCEHSTVSVAAAIQTSGCSPGTAFAFLLVAPSTNLATLGAVTTSSSNSISLVWKVPCALAIGSLFVSYFIDALGVDMIVSASASGGMDIPPWFIPISSYAFIILLFCSIARRLEFFMIRSKQDLKN